MAWIDERAALTRERRSGALSAFHGTLGGLKTLMSGETRQTLRTMTQCAPDDIVYAIRVLAGIEGAAVIIHGSAGCAASALFAPDASNLLYSTNLDEKDSILGGDEKLREAISRAASRGASAVFVLGTPVTAINNDDVNSVISEFEDRTGVKVTYANTDGFKSKTPVTGYDIASHCLLRGLVEHSRSEGSQSGCGCFINLITMSESPSDVLSVLGMFEDLGISVNVLPRYSSADSVKRASRAAASVALNGGECEYLVDGLEESFGVRAIRTDSPIGIEAAERFIRAAAGALGVEQEAERYIAERRGEADEAASKTPLSGYGVFLNMDLEPAASFAALVSELGGKVTGVAVPYVDEFNKRLLDKFHDNATPFIVANGQPFEIANALSKTKSDFCVVPRGIAASVLPFGIVPIEWGHESFFGWDGILAFSSLISRLKNSRGIKPFRGEIYKKTWLSKSGNWHVKTEVR
ncbi:MAG: nitrogenase component 1 [Synergistaceae bacterium]|jgi:nitrogenase molybdenum-iron protein alpha chain|nr:nitrogenase component 1 [Synergistaceae bacterium]